MVFNRANSKFHRFTRSRGPVGRKHDFVCARRIGKAGKWHLFARRQRGEERFELRGVGVIRYIT
jgi:hypothetical protein